MLQCPLCRRCSKMNINKLLAEIAIHGIFAGSLADSKTIICFLDDEPISDFTRICLRALLLINASDYSGAVNLLAPWCTKESKLDTAHGFLALAYWLDGQIEPARHWCTRLISESEDTSSRELANDVLLQIRG